jgi:hypothetical protein
LDGTIRPRAAWAINALKVSRATAPNLQTFYASGRSALYQLYLSPASFTLDSQRGKTMVDVAFIAGLFGFFVVLYAFSLACNRL